MTNAAYFTILTYSVLAVFLLSAIIYRYRKDIKYWWLRSFTETVLCTEFKYMLFPPVKGEVYWMGGPNMQDGHYMYLGKDKFKRVM